MNMRRGNHSWRGDVKGSYVTFSPSFWFPLLLLPILLIGCGSGTLVNPELHSGDGILQTLQRIFLPKSYWESKVAVLDRALRVEQGRFQQRNQVYRNMLGQRRDAVLKAVSKAEAEGTNPRTARRESIQKYRAAIDPLRADARELGKQLRNKMELLVQAQMILRQLR